jgi:predicted small secreted protein
VILLLRTGYCAHAGLDRKENIMKGTIVFIGIVGLLASFGLTSCSSTKGVAQEAKDYQNLQQRAGPAPI